MQKLRESGWMKIATVVLSLLLSIGGAAFGVVRELDTLAGQVGSMQAVIGTKLEMSNERLKKVEDKVDIQTTQRFEILTRIGELDAHGKLMDDKLSSVQRQLTSMRKEKQTHEP